MNANTFPQYPPLYPAWQRFIFPICTPYSVPYALSTRRWEGKYSPLQYGGCPSLTLGCIMGLSAYEVMDNSERFYLLFLLFILSDYSCLPIFLVVAMVCT